MPRTGVMRLIELLPGITAVLLLITLATFAYVQLSAAPGAIRFATDVGMAALLPLVFSFQVYRGLESALTSQELARRTRDMPRVRGYFWQSRLRWLSGARSDGDGS